MSYDVDLLDPTTGKVIEFADNHDIRGGTYALGGSAQASLNITYNYYRWFREAIDAEQGLRWLYGKTAAETIPVLETAVRNLGTQMSDDYWQPTAGNAGAALAGLLEFARRRPDGVWAGD